MARTQDDRQFRKPLVLKAALLVATLASGAAIMVYELLAVRILQRDFGGTIDVWAAEIAVCLAALAIGYSIGGHLGDRFESPRLLGLALFVGGATGLLIHPLAEYSGDVLLQVDFAIDWHPLVAAGFSTFLPILALGTIMPQAIRLQAERLEGVGSAAGWIAAMSTCGGIGGILLTAMVLLRHYGVIEILTGMSVLVAGLGLAVAVAPRVKKQAVSVALLLLVLPTPAQGQVRFETYSAYHHIIVRDGGDTRALLFDDAVQSLMSLRDPYAGGFEYTDYFHVPKLFDPTIKRVLFIGLGGGTGPKSFYKAYPDMQIDVVEIDPKVVDVARQYFALPEDPRLRVHVADGRAFLRRASGRYGAILLDAYGTGPQGPYLPYHMATKEFFQLVWKKLVNGGSLFFNAIGEFGGMQDQVIRHLQVTIESVFQASYVFQAQTSVNTVFIAQKIDPSKLAPDGTRDGKGWPEGPWLAHSLSGKDLQTLVRHMGEHFHQAVPEMRQRVTQFSRAHSAPRRGEVLTDNYAPVDIAPGRR